MADPRIFVRMRALAINYMIGLDQNCIYSQRRSRICVGRAIKQGLYRFRGLNFFLHTLVLMTDY